MADTPGTDALRAVIRYACLDAETALDNATTTIEHLTLPEPAEAALRALAIMPDTLAAWADESGIAPQLLDALLARLTPEAREAALIDGGWVARHHPDECPRSYGPMDPCRCGSRPLYRFTTKGASDGD